MLGTLLYVLALSGTTAAMIRGVQVPDERLFVGGFIGICVLSGFML